MVDKRKAYGLSFSIPKTRDHLEDLDRDGRKILKCIFNLEGYGRY
jgi:hypothetical protein